MQTPTRPDIDRLISGGQVRRHRRNTARVGFAAAVVLVGGGAFGLTQLDDRAQPDRGIATEPSPTESDLASLPVYQDTNGGPVEPGVNRVFIGDSESGASIEAQVDFAAGGWVSGNYPVLYADAEGRSGVGEREGVTAAGLGIYRPGLLADGPACMTEGGESGTLQMAAGSVRGVARQLAALPRSTVVVAPTETEAFGHRAVHLRLRIADNCASVGGAYRIAETEAGSRGVTYSGEPQVVVMDFIVVDLDGTPVVIDMWFQDGAPRELVDRVTAARDSIALSVSP